MQLYSHFIDLRIWHDDLDPALVTSTLAIDPNVAWRKGDARKTPKGTLLGGIRRTGYWAANPFGYGWRDSTDALVEDALEELIAFLAPHQGFLQELSQAGELRVWVSTCSIRNYALDLSPSMLARISSLGLALVHDVYQ